MIYIAPISRIESEAPERSRHKFLGPGTAFQYNPAYFNPWATCKKNRIMTARIWGKIQQRFSIKEQWHDVRGLVVAGQSVVAMIRFHSTTAVHPCEQAPAAPTQPNTPHTHTVSSNVTE